MLLKTSIHGRGVALENYDRDRGKYSQGATRIRKENAWGQGKGGGGCGEGWREVKKDLVQ